MRVRWPDENRRAVATWYATSAAKYKTELLAEAARAAHGEGKLGQAFEARMREAKRALRGLNPWASGGKFEEVVRWLGEFDSAGTLVEEWPAMRPWVLPAVEAPGSRYEEREAGGPPPGWMRGWLPLVSGWEMGQRRRKGPPWTVSFKDVSLELKEAYNRGIIYLTSPGE